MSKPTWSPEPSARPSTGAALPSTGKTSARIQQPPGRRRAAGTPTWSSRSRRRGARLVFEEHGSAGSRATFRLSRLPARTLTDPPERNIVSAAEADALTLPGATRDTLFAAYSAPNA